MSHRRCLAIGVVVAATLGCTATETTTARPKGNACAHQTAREMNLEYDDVTNTIRPRGVSPVGAPGVKMTPALQEEWRTRWRACMRAQP